MPTYSGGSDHNRGHVNSITGTAVRYAEGPPREPATGEGHGRGPA